MSIQKVIAFDPGVTTGIAIATLTDPIQYETFHQQGHVSLWNFLNDEVPDAIVYEKFFYQRRDKVVLEPVEIIGIIKLYAALTFTDIVGLSAQQAKVFWTDAKIRQLGLWETNRKHGMDALRHLLYYLQFERDINIVGGLRDTTNG